jgi:hypothetical protein
LAHALGWTLVAGVGRMNGEAPGVVALDAIAARFVYLTFT